jgi:hypothetical protein
MDAGNPYQAPVTLNVADRPILTDAERRRGRRLVVLWIIVFVMNLPFPVLCGLTVTDTNARWGMLGAIVFLLGLGWRFCRSVIRFLRPWIWGMSLLALTQFLPILQILAGFLALFIGKAFGVVHDPIDPDMDFSTVVGAAGGVIATLVTSATLALVSAMFALAIWSLTPSHWWISAETDESDHASGNSGPTLAPWN